MLKVGDQQAEALGALTGEASLRAVSEPPLACLHESTHHLPPHDQFDAWRAANSSFLIHHPPRSRPARFEAEATTWSFSRFALTKAETPSGRYSRTNESLRRDGLDHWCLSLALHGSRMHRTRDCISLMRPGQLMLDSLAQPFEVTRTRSSWLFLYFPREVLPQAHSPAQGTCLLESPQGRMLGDYLRVLAAELPHLTAADADRLAGVTQAMIALAVPHRLSISQIAPGSDTVAQIIRLRSIIRANLGSATFGPARLCRLAGISRSQLYRVFEAHGGVAAFIQRERLAAAHRALANPADQRSIGDIAESVGLFDPSSFSRMFRRRFGISPRELRLVASAGVPFAMAHAATNAGRPSCLPDLLRLL